MSKDSQNGMVHNNFAVNTTITGNINAASDIRIDGGLQGNVECTGKVIIGEQSRVQGNIVAVNAEIHGQVRGNIVVKETLTLKSTSSVEGDITTRTLVIELNAVFNGTCQMQSAKPEK